MLTARLPLLSAVLAAGAFCLPLVSAVPDFGPDVLIFDPTMTDIQGRIDAVFARQERSQFGPDRYAYLFKPGTYELDEESHGRLMRPSVRAPWTRAARPNYNYECGRQRRCRAEFSVRHRRCGQRCSDGRPGMEARQ